MMKKKRKRIHKFGGNLAASYEKYLDRELDKCRLQGARVTVKVYKGRAPKLLLDRYEMSNQELKDENLLIVALYSSKVIIAYTLIESAFYFRAIKAPASAAGAEDNDYMIECVENTFLRPLRRAIETQDNKTNRKHRSSRS
tara:strand:+ start:342 stop:764 length:423 start_codon:yes stop_codon:yes gene_type:complete